MNRDQIIKSILAERRSEEIEAERFFAELAEPCLDKNGKQADVLVIDTDPAGMIGEYLKRGNPFTIAKNGEIQEDAAALGGWLGVMSNIDLTDDVTRHAVGFTALQKARDIVRAYFWATAGIDERENPRTGKIDTYIDEGAGERLQGFIGHLINSEVAGQPFSEVKKMSLSEAQQVIEMVGLSNREIHKSQGEGG
ncbi:MAG: hypothetical protein ABJP34_10600 [Erythrobacter sp.]